MAGKSSVVSYQRLQPSANLTLITKPVSTLQGLMKVEDQNQNESKGASEAKEDVEAHSDCLKD